MIGKLLFAGFIKNEMLSFVLWSKHWFYVNQTSFLQPIARAEFEKARVEIVGSTRVAIMYVNW